MLIDSSCMKWSSMINTESATPHQSVNLGSLCDNVEVDPETGDLWFGCHPNGMKLLMFDFKDPPGSEVCHLSESCAVNLDRYRPFPEHDISLSSVFLLTFTLSQGHPCPECPFWAAAGDSGVCRQWRSDHGLLCGSRLWWKTAHRHSLSQSPVLWVEAGGDCLTPQWEACVQHSNELWMGRVAFELNHIYSISHVYYDRIAQLNISIEGKYSEM